METEPAGARTTQRNRVVTVAAVAAAVIGGVLVAWLLLGGGQDDGVGSATPTPSLQASAETSPTVPPETPESTPTPEASIPSAGWTLNSLPGGPIRGAARIGDRWVALDGLMAWTSANGADWEEALVDDTPQEADGQLNLGPVAALGGTYYSVGTWFGLGDAAHPVVWSTADGSAWSQVAPTASWGYYANDVASNGSLLAVAVGDFDYGDGGIWTSLDAATWTERSSNGGPAGINAIHGDQDGFVAVGFRVHSGGAAVPTIWHSRDGESWIDAVVPASDLLTLLDVVRLPGGRYVALGIAGTEIDAGQYVAWWADDPASWSDAGIFTAGSVPGLLLRTDAGVMCVVGTLRGPAAWTTADGVTWTEDPTFPLPDVLVRATASATDGSTVVVLGGTDEADAHFAWVGR